MLQYLTEKIMTKDFYDKLQKIIFECEQHPYEASQPYSFESGWEGRISKECLGTWTKEYYDILLHHKDEKVNEMCGKSRLKCFVLCDKSGCMYLAYH